MASALRWWLAVALGLAWMPVAPSEPLQQQGTRPTMISGLKVSEDLPVTIELGGAPLRFELLGLEPNAAYEARVSHAADTPVHLRLWLEDGEAAAAFRQRQLLNTDKLVFVHDAIQGPRIFAVEATLAGVVAPGHEAPTHARIHVTLERLYAGVLPARALHLAPALAASLCFAFCVLYPRIRRRLKRAAP
jgi:hypothetical protein